MTSSEFLLCLKVLDLTMSEAARLLSVSSRTIRRWAEYPTEIPGPAEQALQAWMRLERANLAWRPDGIAIGEANMDEIAEKIGAHRRHAIELDELLQKVSARGGPIAPWVVDVEKKRADLGSISVSFYRLANGGFSPSVYRRNDADGTDLERDWPLIEDAFACIANAIAHE